MASRKLRIGWAQVPAGPAPVILYTDFIAGPLSGGEDGGGAYLRVFGLNFGPSFAHWGVSNHLLINGVPPLNYRFLREIYNGELPDYGQIRIQELAVQLGPQGDAAPGDVLKISMTCYGQGLANHTDGNGNYKDYLTLFGNISRPLTWTVQPGPILFSSPSGNNSNSGTISSPKLGLQESSGFGTAIIRASTSDVATNGTVPGTWAVLRGGTYDGGLGNGGCFAKFFRSGGTPATGAANRGPICITVYPGPAGANAPEEAIIEGRPVNGAGGGGFFGNDNARSNVNNPWSGLPSFATDIHLANMTIISHPNAARDGGPVYANNGAHRWRVINIKMTWPWESNADNITNAGGFTGNGHDIVIAGNYIYDIRGVTSGANGLQNHHIYLDTGNWWASKNTVIAFNVMADALAGNSVQSYASGSGTNDGGVMTELSIHHNVVARARKHNFNIAAGTRSAHIYNNLSIDAGEHNLCAQPGNVMNSANGIIFANNTCIGWGMVLANRAAQANTGGTGTGSVGWVNNILRQRPLHAANSYNFNSLDGAGSNNLGYNQYFDPDGRLLTKPAADTTGNIGNPLLVSPETNNYKLQPGSPCRNTAGTTGITRGKDLAWVDIVNPSAVGCFEYAN